MRWKRKIAILAVPAALALAGGAMAVHGASSPGPTPPSAQKEADEQGQVGEIDTAGDQGQQGPAEQSGDQGQQGPGDQVQQGPPDTAGQSGDQGQSGEVDQANEAK